MNRHGECAPPFLGGLEVGVELRKRGSREICGGQEMEVKVCLCICV